MIITFTEIEEILIKLGVDRSHFRINETPVEGPPYILCDGKVTEVFFSERGIKFDLKIYEDKLEGIRDFVERVLKHESDLKRWKQAGT